MNSEQFFLDSNFVIALMDTHDVHHNKAKALLYTIQKKDHQIFFSDVVINEVLSVFAKRCESKGKSHYFETLSKKFHSDLKNIPILCLYELLPKYFKDIFNFMNQYQGKLNFHDAMIALFLKEVPKVHLVTYDKDFSMIPCVSIFS